ncbi:MAG: HAD-IC family P-type ATPase, partial [Sphingomonadales bacterium]
MCPGVRQKGFGTCPSCGMALEPENPLLDEGPNPELVDFQKRFWIGLIFTLPVFVLEMGTHVFGLKLPFSAGVSQWVQLVLSAPVVLWAGYPVLERGVNSIRQRSLNMFTLIALGVAVAFGYSLVAVLLPGLFPPEFKNEHGLVAVYFEAASVITVLVLLGQVMELRARARTTGALKALLDLAPKTALRLTNGEEEEIALDDVQSGDELRVKPGGRVPVDGVILSGHGDVDESMVTGESMPVSKAAGDHAIGGTVNQNGAFVLRAEAVGADSLLSRIAMQVAQAQRSRAPIQRLADNVAGYFVPAVVAVSLLAFLAWWLYGPEPSLTYGLVAAVSVLI